MNYSELLQLAKGWGNFISGRIIIWRLRQMSLVGFRPALKSEYEEYEYHHRARIAMKPGITGMWQVSGRSDITDFEEVVKLV